MKRGHEVLAVVGLLVLGQVTGVRADKKLAQEFYKKGMAAFTLEKYDKAIAEFTSGFENEPDPVFLFNIAQAYRLSNRGKEAIKFYQKYLKLAPHASNRRMVEEKIAALTKALGPSYEPLPLSGEPATSPIAIAPSPAPSNGSASSSTSTSVAKGAAEAAAPASATPTSHAAPTAALHTTPPKPTAQPRRRWPVWVGVAAGVAAAGLGVGLGVGLTQTRATELPLQDAR